MENNKPLTDDDREEILRLVLLEAGGTDVKAALSHYPISVRNTFRGVVEEAGLVKTRGTLLDQNGEAIFQQPVVLTERGKKRLMELNLRRDGER